MSTDFWAGYFSGVAGIIVGNPLDVVKVRLQARDATLARWKPIFRNCASPVTGAAGPIMGYGALNALLFAAYNRTATAIDSYTSAERRSLWTTWLAGAVGGLATWIVSAPTELIKCRTQVLTPTTSSWTTAQSIYNAQGIRGLYYGGTVTALRDSVGYGFYFWSYELALRHWPYSGRNGKDSNRHNATAVLLCGGLAGIVTWASVFPLDVIKTRLQTMPCNTARGPRTKLRQQAQGSPITLQVAVKAFRDDGIRVFFRGFAACSVRAFVVNAVQWTIYEWIMHEFA